MSTKSVMIVEDDLDIRENMVLLLEGEGYEVLSAENGQEALDRLLNKSMPLPKLIALDLFMPIMDGKSFLEELSRHNERDFTEVSIFLITAADAAARHDLIGKTTGVLRKPIDINAFLTLVRQHCD